MQRKKKKKKLPVNTQKILRGMITGNFLKFYFLSPQLSWIRIALRTKCFSCKEMENTNIWDYVAQSEYVKLAICG